MTSALDAKPFTTIMPSYRDRSRLQCLRAEFRRNRGFVRLPSFFSPSTFDRIRSDIEALYRKRKRRDFLMPDFKTERKMSVVGGDVIRQACPSLLRLYSNAELQATIATIVGRQIQRVFHKDEFMVVNFLDRQSDTHGWHTDDPQYALVAICEASGLGNGGALEFVANWRDFRAQCDKSSSIDEQIARARTEGRVREEQFESGDAYLLDANSNLHRVTPLLGTGKRQALNMAFDDRLFRKYGVTAHLLYGVSTS